MFYFTHMYTQRAQDLPLEPPVRVLLAKDSSKHLLRLWLCTQRLHEMLEAVVDERWGMDLTYARLTDLITSNILYVGRGVHASEG